MSDDHELMTSILDWFAEVEEWIPGARTWVGELLLGPIPLASANSVYDLADQWGDLAEALNDAYSDVMQMANPILESWSGDGAAQVFVEQWFAYLEGLRQTAESAAQMQRGVQNFGLEVELMKFMAALNLIMLAVSLFMLIAAAIPTGGGSLGAAPGLFAGTRIALAQAAEKTVGKIASIAMRIVMRSLTRLFGKLPAAVARRVLPAAVRTVVPQIARIVAGRVVAAGTRVMTGNALGRAARAVAARGISKAVANRMAAQALRGLAAREINGTLRNQATRAVQRQLAKEIRQQLLRKWAGKEAREVGENALAKIAAREVAEAGLGREFAGYVGTRVAFGAGFMGGGNLLGQFGQILSGNRTEGVDWAQVKDGVVQGAAFGAGMFGGPLGHAIGGAAAGGGLALGQEYADYVGSGGQNKIDWGAVGHGAVQGGAAGVIFGTQTVLEQAKFSLPHTRLGPVRIGADVHVLPGHDGGFNILATRANNHEGLLLTSDGYVAFQGRDGVAHLPEGLADRPDIAQVRDEHFSKLDVDPEAARKAAETSTGDIRTDPPTGTRAETGGGSPARSGDGGGGGGGPRQNASGGGTTTRAGEPVRSAEPTPRTIERVRVPGGDGAPTGDRTAPVDRGGSPEATGDRAPADRTASTGRDSAPTDGGGDPPGSTTRGGTGTGDRAPADHLAADRTSDDGPSTARTSDSAPTDRAPTDRVPADGVPADRGPADRVPTDGAPADRAQADRVPTDRAAADRPPADRGPVDRAPGGEGRTTADGSRTGGDRTAVGGDRVGPRDSVAPGGDRAPAGGSRVGGDRAPVGGDRVPAGSETPRGTERSVRDGADAAPTHPHDGRPAGGAPRAEGEGTNRRGADPTRDAGTAPTDRAAARSEHQTGTRDTVPSAREGGDGGPPPGGPPHDPTGARPEQTHPADEAVMRSAGSEVGEPATPESIRQGTVRMELHPEFPEVVRFLEEHGFRLVEDPAGPRAVQRHVYSADGKTLLRVEREVRHLDGMRFLDLEHEIDHVRQLTDRFHGELGTEAVRERANGTQVEMRNAPRILSAKYDTVVEYHVRLQEAIRLIERGVDPALVREHLAGVDERRALMTQKVSHKDATAQAWRREHFGDIPSLERRLGELRTEFESGATRSEGPAGRPDTGDGPRMAKPATPGHADDHLPTRDEPARDEQTRDEPARDEPARDEPAAQRDADPAEPAPDASTGAAIRPRDEVRAFDWADRAYDRFRADDADVAEIAANLADTPRPDGGGPFTPAEIHQIKQHLMVEDHPIRDYDGTIEMRRFDASPDIAEAWIRLREGHPLPEDLVLLGHELAESNYMRQHPEADYRTAHEAANEQHNWQDIVPERTGEDLDIKWGRHSDNGDSGRLPADPGNRDTGGVPLRTSGDGPPPGDREVHAGGHSLGRDGGPHVRGGVHEDPAAAAGTPELAGGRDVRGVDPARLVSVDGPVPERPVAAPRDVAAVLDRQVTDLVRGREAGPADQPHRADWDPQARTLRVRYGDGLEVDVVVQVNESVPPGRSVVVRPPMEAVEGGGWRQTEPAGVVLSSHLPADPVARGPHVEESLREAWRTLHDEVGEQLRLPDPADGAPPPHDAGPAGDGPPPVAERPAPDALRALEEPVAPEVPVRDADVVGRHPVTPADPPPPAPLTPEGVRQSLAGRGGPEQLGRWAGEHLVDPAENGRVQPKPADEIAAVVDRFADEAADLVAPAPERTPVDEVRHNASPIAETEFVPDGRPWHQPDVSPGELHRAAHGTMPTDFADGRVVAVHSEGPYVKVTLADGGERHFVPQVGHGMRDLAETIVRAGTADDPHLVYVNHRVAADQLPRVWVHEITETLALQHAAQSRPEPHGLVRRAMTAIGRIFGGGEARPEATPRVEPHVAARLNERVHLQRLHDWAGGRPEEQARLRREIDGVDRDLAALGHRVDPPEVYRRVQDWGLPDTSHLTGVIGGRPEAASTHGPAWHGTPHDAVPQQRLPHDLTPSTRPPHDPAPPWAAPHDGAPPWAARHDLAPSHDPGPSHPAPHDLDPQHSVPHDATPPEPSHDGHWTDKPWEREGRRPSFDELIPVTEAEAAKWAGEVKAEFGRQLEGREFGDGFRVRFDEDNHPISVYRNEVVLRLKVYDADGSLAGRTVRVFAREHDGSLYVTHSSIKLSDGAQGRGFSDGWNSFLEGWYRESGVHHIEVHAVDRGAYAWARAGYEWAPNTEHRADQVLGKLRAGVRRIDEHLDQLARWQRGEAELDVAPLLERYGVDHPDQLPERMRYERDAGQHILDRADRHRFGSPDYPQPQEISRAGADGRSGRDQVWIGKEALLGSDWKGVKPISDGGVVHPHPRVESTDARPITAAAVPEGEFHGAAREVPEPEVVRSLAGAALADAPPVRFARVDLDVVPADTLPDGAVARSVPVDGAGHDLPDGHLPPPDGGYRIEVSDRAGDLAVPRAIRHEVAELNAIGERARAGLDLDVPNVLRPGDVPDGPLPTRGDLSPHDLGRLAERDYLHELARDPEHAAHARAELDALDRHLGLHPDDPGATARRQVVEDHRAARDDDGPPPTRRAHLLAFDDTADGPMQHGTMRRLAFALGQGGDEVALRIPGAEAAEPAPGVRVLRTDPVPGVTGRISPLLRPDGLPRDVDVLVGYGQTAGVAEVRRDVYPDARVVQVLDAVPADPKHLAVLARADLIVAVGPDVAAGVREALAGLGEGPVPELREVVATFDAGPPPPPPPVRDGFHLLVVADRQPTLISMAETVRELQSRGIDARLTVALPEGHDFTAERRAEILGRTGVEVEIRPLPREPGDLTALLHDADVVLDPGDRALVDGTLAAAAGHGVPVLAAAEGGIGRLLGDPQRVSGDLGAPSVIGRDAGPAGWADRLQGLHDRLPTEHERALALRAELTERYGPEQTARAVRSALDELGPAIGRVDEAAWRGDLNPREVLLRRHDTPEPPTDGTLRVMTVCTEYKSTRGGVITANQELTGGFAAAGAEVYGRVSTVDASQPWKTVEELDSGVHVRGVQEVWGVRDAKNEPDARALSMLFENLPPHVDVIVGNSRFGGGAARILSDHVYPDAKYVHVLHTSPEVLDAVRGNPAEGQGHATTERALMDGADLVTGIGPLLGPEAARLGAMAVPGNPPRAHTIISDMPRNPADPPAKPAHQRTFELHVQGRAGDPIKGIDFAAEVVAQLRADGVDVRLTVRGAPNPKVQAEMAEQLSRIVGAEVEVRGFVKSFTDEGRAQLLRDLHDADLVLMPSVQEGFGLVASEAARAGVPVLVGEGTGAGLFFGNDSHVPSRHGEAAVVRDGVTVRALLDAVRAEVGDTPQFSKEVAGRIIRGVDASRRDAWTAQIKATLADIGAHRVRALELRDYLNDTYPTGASAKRLLDVLRGVVPADMSPTAQSGGSETLHSPGATHRAGPRSVRDLSSGADVPPGQAPLT